ncbi:MAG TPA: TIGR01212 family radical SAM protein [Dissulfurispiraceae bacterium]|nr:TIGR01212 family radical SAM protein [Dissulfurispiraceae bacterium]
MAQQYQMFGPWLKKRFGTIVYKVNVDAGFTCPNRDGTLGNSGCIYCNNDSFRPSRCAPELPLKEQIRNGMRYLSGRYKAGRFLVYFQPYTNTYAPVAVLERLYREALSFPEVVGLAIGTRPDCVDREKIALLQQLARERFVLVEYGVQSIYDKSLEFIRRGHTYQTFLDAIEMTANRGIEIGAHLIVGFPTETREEMLAMADAMSRLPIRLLKIHQLQVITRTLLADIYAKTPFPIFNYPDYLDFLVDFIERLPPHIILQRLFATAPDAILVAPRWERTRQQILRDIEQRFVDRNAFQGSQCIRHRD